MSNIRNIWDAEEGANPAEIRDLEAMADLLAFAPEPVAPSAGLRDRVLAIADAEPTAKKAPAAAMEKTPAEKSTPAKPPFVMAAERGKFERSRGWRTILPGVHVRALAREKRRGYSSTMMRMEPGSEYPAHRHEVFEEVCVLEGECSFDDFVMGPGDYYQARPGTVHGPLTTRAGCVMLITEVAGPDSAHEE